MIDLLPSFVDRAASMLEPGAIRSMPIRPSLVGPMLEYGAVYAPYFETLADPTVVAYSAVPGDVIVWGLSPLLPAATTTTTPAATTLFTRMLVLSRPSWTTPVVPSDMFTTLIPYVSLFDRIQLSADSI